MSTESKTNNAQPEGCAASTCSRSWVPPRFDPISHHNNGPGWSWDAHAIKECDDGEYVKFEAFEEARKLADEALDTLRIIREKYGLGNRHVAREKNREIAKLRETLAAAEPHMRHELNCLARSGNFPCGCGMVAAWERVRAAMSSENVKSAGTDASGKTI